MRAIADFSYLIAAQSITEKDKDIIKADVSRDRWLLKVNFVKIHSFWHVLRSQDRRWTFYILILQVMIIMAWDGGEPGSVFGVDVLKVLSVFITNICNDISFT